MRLWARGRDGGDVNTPATQVELVPPCVAVVFPRDSMRAVKNAVSYYVGGSPALDRQKNAVQIYAAAHKLKIVRDFWDGSSDTPITDRTGLAAMLAYVLGGGARVVLIEDPDLLTPDPAAQITAQMMLEKNRIELVPVLSKDWMAAKAQVMLQSKRLMFGDVVNSVLDTARLFATRERLQRMKVGRDKASERLGYRVEGRAAWGRFPESHVELARQLKAQGKSLRQISAELAKRGMLNNAGKPYGAQSVARQLRGS
jgi:Resolvase, N terminal domain